MKRVKMWMLEVKKEEGREKQVRGRERDLRFVMISSSFVVRHDWTWLVGFLLNEIVHLKFDST